MSQSRFLTSDTGTFNCGTDWLLVAILCVVFCLSVCFVCFFFLIQQQTFCSFYGLADYSERHVSSISESSYFICVGDAWALVHFYAVEQGRKHIAGRKEKVHNASVAIMSTNFHSQSVCRAAWNTFTLFSSTAWHLHISLVLWFISRYTKSFTRTFIH